MNLQKQTVIPTEEEIEETLQAIQDALEIKGLKMAPGVREGLEEMVDILADDRKTYAGIAKLKTVRARAIAMLGVDYLHGIFTQKEIYRIDPCLPQDESIRNDIEVK